MEQPKPGHLQPPPPLPRMATPCQEVKRGHSSCFYMCQGSTIATATPSLNPAQYLACVSAFSWAKMVLEICSGKWSTLTTSAGRFSSISDVPIPPCARVPSAALALLNSRVASAANTQSEEEEEKEGCLSWEAEAQLHSATRR
jgi:hypothetical protein